jgi:acyl-CoA synthetase (AMP-forming)/AMP-acid ligase II
MSFHSPFPDVVIPDTSVYDYLFADIEDEDEDRFALIDAATRTALSYSGLVTRIDAFAAALAHRGIGIGDTVGLLSPNSAAFAVAFHGILRTGATATTVNALFTADEIEKSLRTRRSDRSSSSTPSRSHRQARSCAKSCARAAARPDGPHDCGHARSKPLEPSARRNQ